VEEKMNINIPDKSLIITSAKIKQQILLNLTAQKQLIDVKFMNINEFKNNYLGTYKEDAIYYLMKNYKLNYDVAKEYLANIFYNYLPLKKYYDDLLSHNYLIFNEYFKANLNKYHIIVINYSNIDQLLKNTLISLNAEFIENTPGTINPLVLEFNTIDAEINYVLSDISSKTTGNLNNFYLVNLDDNYELPLKRIAKMYHLPINFNHYKSIYSTKIVQDFLNTLISTHDLNESLNQLAKNNIYDAIIDILNKYTIPEAIDDVFITLIKNELEQAKIKIPQYCNAINVISYQEMTDQDAYYYFMNFNEAIVPKNYFDDELIKDKDRLKIGLNTSFDNLTNEKNSLKNILFSYPHLVVTYKLKDYFNQFLPSPLIKDLNLKVASNLENNYEYSNEYNQLLLAQKLDNYSKFNELDASLESLYATYPDIKYKTYDNSFKGVDYELLKAYLKGKTNLSYSSLDNYYKCSFRFYIANILKLDPFKDTFMTFIGSLFHDSLSHMYEPNFDLKKTYESFLTKRQLSNKEKFFTTKLYQELANIIKVIKLQDSHSKFNMVMTEKHIAIDKSHDLKVNFLGFVDKIKYEEKDNTMIIAIVDYKTGSPEIALDNVNYGLHLQLPIYIYLATNGIGKKVKIAGFYLQKILNPKVFDSDNPDDDLKNSLKWEGYTIDDEDIINDLDDTNATSVMIKGLGKTSAGEYKKGTKLINQKEITKLNILINDLIDQVVLNVEHGNFKINPKRINDKLIGCEYCHFKDICFRKEEDIVTIENTPRAAILGGEDNANMDE
jgi:ATP-dependent helicase/DNAse subunit B